MDLLHIEPADGARCACVERGYCADVPDDPKACPVCRSLGQDDDCPRANAGDLPTIVAALLGCDPNELRPARRDARTVRVRA